MQVMTNDDMMQSGRIKLLWLHINTWVFSFNSIVISISWLFGMKRILSVMMNNKLLVIVIKKQVTNTLVCKFPLCFCSHWSPHVTLASGRMTGPPVTDSPRVLTVHVSRVWSSSHPGTAPLVTSSCRTSCMAAAPPVSSKCSVYYQI